MGLLNFFRKRKQPAGPGQPQAKRFKLPREQIQRLIPNMGGCIASDMITVEGYPVGYMYREYPRNEVDSGWVFLSGLETREYMDNPANHGVYEVNTICNCDRSIIPHLDAIPGTAFIRDPATGLFTKERLDRSDESLDDSQPGSRRAAARAAGLNPGFPFVEGQYKLTAHWTLTLPAKFSRRFADKELCLWRPGFTIWASVFGNDQRTPREERMCSLRDVHASKAFGMATGETDDLSLLSYRLAEPSEDQRRPVFHCLAVADDGHLQLAMYFDDEDDLRMAQAIWGSVQWRK